AELEIQRLDRAKVAVIFTEINQLDHDDGLGLVAAAGGCVVVSRSMPSAGASGSAGVSNTLGSTKSSARFLSGFAAGSGPRARCASTSVYVRFCGASGRIFIPGNRSSVQPISRTSPGNRRKRSAARRAKAVRRIRAL